MKHVHRPAQGFSLIELVVVVAIISILAAIAIPAYEDYVRGVRRSDATATLVDIQTKQEKYFINNNRFADDLADLGISGTEHGLYTLALAAPNPTQAYTVTATATGVQANDDDCASFTVNSEGAQTAVDSNGADNSTYCWD